VTQNNISSSHCRWAAGGFAAAVLLCATSGIAQAQSSFENYAQNSGSAAAGAAPSADAGPAQSGAKPAGQSTLTPPAQPPSPQLATQGQAPNPPPTQSANQPSANQLNANQPNATQSATTQSGAPQSGASQASAPSGAPDEKRGFLNGFGQWWDESIANFNAKLKEQQVKLEEFNKQQSEAAKDATQKMKDAADAMFSPSKIVETQQLCPVAGNGAPDCASAATNVCKAKGFSDGKPIDIRSAERCKASLWVSGQNPATANCPVETVLLRVACQQ
jgi:hypothetical protein